MESPITLLLFFSLIVLIKIPTTTANDDSENDLKMRISKVAPLAEMFLKKDPSKGRGLFSSNNSKKYHRQGQYAQPAEQKDYGGGSYGGGYEGGGHGGGGGYGGGYYEQYYDDYKDDLLPVLAVLALSSLLFYLITVATTSSTAGRRKRYTQDVSQEDIVFMDPGTWMSLMHNIWDDKNIMANDVCIQRELCAMNRIARSVSKDTGWAVSLSSLPLSYLIHNHRNGGFLNYLDASLAGGMGTNCAVLYDQCLH